MKTLNRSRTNGWLVGLTALALAWLLSACSMLHVEGDVKQVRACKRTALLEAALVPPLIPPFPLIDAAIYKSNMKPAVPEIISLHEKESRTLADRIGVELQNGQTSKLLYGSNLYGMEAYKSLAQAVATYPLEADLSMRMEGMNHIYLPEGSLNFLRLDDNDGNFYRRHGQMSQGEVFETAKVAADRLDVDCTAVAAADLRYRAGIFGVNGGASLWLTVWYFDRDGRQIVWAVNESEVLSAPAADPSNARASFEKLDQITAALAKQVYHGTPQ